MNKTYKGYKIVVTRDQYPESPRRWGNLGTIVHWHKRYDFGEERVRFETREEHRRFEKQMGEHPVALPLYLYDHSVQSISTRSFHGRAHHAAWDSGRVGYVYASREAILEWFPGWKRITKARKERVREILESEIETFDMYIRGEVYGYHIVTPSGETIPGCYGFYGNPEESGLLDEAKSIVDYEEEKRQEREREQVRAWNRNSGFAPLFAR
jgi:hypothetical protein